MGDLTQQRPAWLAHLGEEDFHFLRRFLLCSGSLKDLAAEYGVSYPTVRGRLDRFIAKVRAAEDPRRRRPSGTKIARPRRRRADASFYGEGTARGSPHFHERKERDMSDSGSM